MQFLLIKPMVFLYDAQIAFFTKQRTCIPCRNAKIALALPLCSRIVLLGAAWVQLEAILGHAEAILGLSWEGLGLFGSTLKLDHQTSKPYTFLNALLEHQLPAVAYKANVCVDGFQLALFLEHQNTDIVDMPESFSR